MPWKASDARHKTHKANTPKKRRKWAKVANAVLKSSGDEGKAVRVANATMADKVRPISADQALTDEDMARGYSRPEVR